MSLKRIVNDKELWLPLMSRLNEEIANAHRTLEGAQDEKDMYRAQGKIQALRRLLTLKEELKNE